MIRINLIAGGRKVAKKRVVFQTGQMLTVACSLILLAAGGVIGWRYREIGKDSRQLDADIASAQRETSRLRGVITQVQQFEQRRGQLQERVTLIEQLRKERTGPVHMLDQISRALPPMIWLTELRQMQATNEVIIDGRSTTLVGLSDFVGNLEFSGYFKRSIEIVSTTTDVAATGGEVIRFQIKAVFQQPGAAAPAPAPASSGGD